MDKNKNKPFRQSLESSQLRENIERHTTIVPIVPEAWQSQFVSWRGNREIVCTLQKVTPPFTVDAPKNWKEQVRRFMEQLSLEQLESDVYVSEHVFAVLDVNSPVLHTTNLDTALQALQHGNATPHSIKRGRRLWRPALEQLPQVGKHVVDYRHEERWTVYPVMNKHEETTAIDTHTITETGAQFDCRFFSSATGAADPCILEQGFSERGIVHALHHLHTLDLSGEQQLDEKELKEKLKKAVSYSTDSAIEENIRKRLLNQVMKLWDSWGHLESEFYGRLVNPFKDMEVCPLDEFVTKADAHAAEGVSSLVLSFHLGHWFESPDMVYMFLDEIGRIWGYNWTRENWFLVAERVEVWFEQWVRMTTCTWGTRHQIRHADEKADLSAGEQWAMKYGCDWVPEASDNVARIWENNETIIVEHTTHKKTYRYDIQSFT